VQEGWFQLIVSFEGRAWELDMNHVRLQQAMTIQLYTGLSIGAWEDSIAVSEERDGDGKPTGKLVNPPPEWLKSIAALYWLMIAQNGVTTPIAEVDFDFPAFLAAVMEAMANEIARLRADAAAKAGEAGPTALPPSPAAPASPEPPTLPATIPQPPAQPPEGAPATAFTPPATLPG
jgi:hypothetical protein